MTKKDLTRLKLMLQRGMSIQMVIQSIIEMSKTSYEASVCITEIIKEMAKEIPNGHK